MPNTLLVRPDSANHEYHHPSVEDHVFDRARKLVGSSGILSRLMQWRDDDRVPGRYEPGGAINDHAILTALLIASIERRQARAADLAAILFERLHPEQVRWLGIADSTQTAAVREAAVRRAIARLLKPIDPFPASRHKRHTYEEAQRVIERHDRRLESRRSARLDELTSRLIATSVGHELDESLTFCVATETIILSGPALTVMRRRNQTGPVRRRGVSDPFAVALPNTGRRADIDGPLWGWLAYLAVPYPPVDFPRSLPLLVAGATLLRPWQSGRNAVLTVIDSASRAGLRRLPIRTSPKRAPRAHRNQTERDSLDIPDSSRGRNSEYGGQRRAELIHARGVDANVLGHLHRRSRGLAHAQLSLALHLAAMNSIVAADGLRDGEYGGRRRIRDDRISRLYGGTPAGPASEHAPCAD